MTAAAGVGLALSRAAEDRAPRRRGRAKRRLGLGPREPLAAGLRRMAFEQADVVIEELEYAAAGEAPAEHVHEARKAIKRLRTIVRLLRGELGREACAREQDSLRAAAALLAGARDAEVMLATLDGVIARGGRKLALRPGVAALRLTLVAERDRHAREALAPEHLTRAIGELRGFRARAACWELRDDGALGAAEPGLRRIYRQGRRRMRRAAGRRGGHMHTMHQWRKRVKDLRYATEALERSPGALASRRARAGAKRLERIARRADRLGELLGEEHDLAVLGAWIERHGAGAGAGAGTRRRLRRRISRRRAKLRRRALREGSELYRRGSRRFVRRAAAGARALSRR